jgi:hypothetical protein
MDPYCPQNRSTDPEYRRRVRLLVLVILVFSLVAIWTIRPDAVRAAVDRMDSMLGRKIDASRPPPAPVSRASKPSSGI